MSTAVPKDGIRTLIAAISGLPAAFILWDGEPKGPVEFSQDARRMILNVVARKRVGEDEEKRAYLDDGDGGYLVETTFSGQRELTVSLRAENFGQEEGFDLLERIRTLLGSDANRLELNELGLSLATIEDVRNLDANAGNRKISVAQMDIRLNHRVEIVVTAAGDTFIETVQTSGDDELEIAGEDIITST